MRNQSKRTNAPAPVGVPPPATQPLAQPPPATHPHAQPPPETHPHAPPATRPHASAFPSTYGPGAWFPPTHSMAPSSAPFWLPGSGMSGSWAPTFPAPTAEIDGDPDVQAWGVDSHPPGGFLNFLKKNTASPAQAMNHGSSSRTINVGDDTNDGESTRTEKRLPWTKDEDLRLVGAWLNNSNDPIQSNYKKNDQYWKGVASVYNSTTPKNRARLVKQVKDHFARIKKRVAWFCASWKEANSLWASGENHRDVMEKAIKTYEEEHKKDGPFMFKHCWEVLRKEPKWDLFGTPSRVGARQEKV